MDYLVKIQPAQIPLNRQYWTGVNSADLQPAALASIWERILDKSTGEILMSFSMLTIHAAGHEVMQHFHKPTDEKRSIVVIEHLHYMHWLNSNHNNARELLKLANPQLLVCEPAPIIRRSRD